MSEEIETVQEVLGPQRTAVIPTGGDEFQQEREQLGDGNNVVALAPGVVVAYKRNGSLARAEKRR